MRTYRPFMLIGLIAAVAMPAVQAQNQKPTVQVPNPGVPQAMTIQANFVRAAWNNEGYAILGYQAANRSIGGPWMLLDFGTTIMSGVKDQKLTRGSISLETPDGKTIPLPSTEEYRKDAAQVQSLQARSKAQRDSINYFPSSAHQACRLGFFSDLDDRAMPWDQVELNSQRGCVGRLYFPIPGGITYGQHWLNVKFAGSMLRVPFRIFTKDEEKQLSKNYKSIKQQIDEFFNPKKK